MPGENAETMCAKGVEGMANPVDKIVIDSPLMLHRREVGAGVEVMMTGETEEYRKGSNVDKCVTGSRLPKPAFKRTINLLKYRSNLTHHHQPHQDTLTPSKLDPEEPGPLLTKLVSGHWSVPLTVAQVLEIASMKLG